MGIRKALCIGIDYYGESGSHLHGCANDALAIGQALALNYDDTRNFQVEFLCAQNESTAIDDNALKSAIKWLFEGAPEIALLYYSGHGAYSQGQGYLCPSNFDGIHHGVSLDTLMQHVNLSKASNKIIFLDCCHSGSIGNYLNSSLALIPENTFILTGCTQDGYAMESNGYGVFTSLLLDALNGADANLNGEITPGSIYSYIDKSLSAFEQRPVFKANTDSFICLKRIKPLIPLRELRLITIFFHTPDSVYNLEPVVNMTRVHTENKEKNEDYEKTFAILRKYEKYGLVIPVEEEFLPWASTRPTGCKLTSLGRSVWTQVYKCIL